MKIRFFTVIAILLLLATAQFAVGDNYLSVVNYEDTEVIVSLAYKATNTGGYLADGVPESARDYYRVQGWYKIEPNKVARLKIEDTREVYLRIQRNGNEVKLKHWRNGKRDTKELLYHPWAKHDIRHDGKRWQYQEISGGTRLTPEMADAELQRIAKRLNLEPFLLVHARTLSGKFKARKRALTYANLYDQISQIGYISRDNHGLHRDGDKLTSSNCGLLYDTERKMFIAGHVSEHGFLEEIPGRISIWAWARRHIIYPKDEAFRKLSNAMIVHAIRAKYGLGVIDRDALGQEWIWVYDFAATEGWSEPQTGSYPTDGLEWGRYWKINFDLGESVYNIGTPPVTIKGLPLTRNSFLDSAYLDHPIPDEGGNAFILFGQGNYNNCGPASLQMVLWYYGVDTTMKEIWRAGGINTVVVGTTPGEMRRASNGLGVPCDWLDDEDFSRHVPDWTFQRLREWIDEDRPPCLLIKTPESFHWIVVVGYAKSESGEDYDYLIADPTGGITDPAGKEHGSLPHFRWETREELQGAWSWKKPSSNPWNAFKAINVSAVLDPYTAIVPRSGATRHFKGYWTELKVHEEYGEIRPTVETTPGGQLIRLGTKILGKENLSTRPWTDSVTFNKPFDSYKVSGVQLISSFRGTAKLTGVSKEGDRRLRLRGKIEDGLVDRGRMWVFARTYRSEAAPAAPAQVTLTRLPAPAAETSLLPNYPNPFNPETWIPYQLSESADVAVSIYAIDGRLVRRLDLGQMPSGVYRSRARAAYWDGRNAAGEPVASGVYFYTLQAGDFKATRKMVIRK